MGREVSGWAGLNQIFLKGSFCKLHLVLRRHNSGYSFPLLFLLVKTVLTLLGGSFFLFGKGGKWLRTDLCLLLPVAAFSLFPENGA